MPKVVDGQSDPKLLEATIAQGSQLTAAPHESSVDTETPNIKQARAYELSPDTAYLIVLDESVYTDEEAGDLMKQLKKIGIVNAVALMSPHDKAVRIIQQDKTNA